MVTSSAVTPGAYAPDAARIAKLADIRRAASLESIRLEVTVAHTNQRLRARFCVSLRRPRNQTWAFGVEIQNVRQFQSRVAALAKAHKGGKCSCRAVHPVAAATLHGCKERTCAMCELLRQERKLWPKFPALSTVGKRHMDTKCTALTHFFYGLFRVLSLNAQWVQSCDLLREMLRMTEALCRVQYDDDDATAVSVIQSLTRVTPVIRTSPSQLQKNNQDGEVECSICLSSLLEPAVVTTLPAAVTEEPNQGISFTGQPTQGVELPCGHRFHDSCICVWFHTKLNCPVCRQNTTDKLL